jgi:hypothetical protein
VGEVPAAQDDQLPRGSTSVAGGEEGRRRAAGLLAALPAGASAGRRVASASAASSRITPRTTGSPCWKRSRTLAALTLAEDRLRRAAGIEVPVRDPDAPHFTARLIARNA